MTSPDPLAWAVMTAYCGWDPTDYQPDATALLDGNGTSYLTLRSLYVTAVDSVTITDWQGAVTTATIGPSGDVGWSKNGGLYFNGHTNGGRVWPVGQQNVSVRYASGYTDPPEDLLAALNNLSGRLTKMGWTSSKMGTAAVAYGAQIAEGGLLLIEQMVFDRYRLPRVA